MLSKRKTYLLSIFTITVLCNGPLVAHQSRFTKVKQSIKKFPKKVAEIIKNIGKCLCSKDSLKIVAVTIATCCLARKYDKKIHQHFFNTQSRQNKHQISKKAFALTDLVIDGINRGGFGIMITGLGSAKLRNTACHVTITNIASDSAKETLKSVVSDIAPQLGTRPSSEGFDPNMRSSSHGMPSGHTTNISSLATLYGLKHGLKAAIPLALLTGWIGYASVATNRHYLSQVLAGAGLGSIFGLAAYKASKKEKKKPKKISEQELLTIQLKLK